MNSTVIEQNALHPDPTVNTELRLIQSSLFGTDFSFDSACDWEAVYADLYAHTVESIPGDIIGKLPIKTEHLLEWKKTCIWRIGNFYKVLQAQSELVTLLKNAEIDFVILKGTAAAIYYPKPQYRTMGDVDFIVDPDKFDEAYRILTENGFTDTECEFARHASFEKNGCEFEMHRYFALNGGTGELSRLDILVFDGIKNAEFHEIDGLTFPVLPMLQNGLTLLQHIKHHLRKSLGLRQILDWMLYVNTCLDDGFWNNEFKKEAQNAGLELLAVNVTRMCQLYLGLDDSISWCKSADEGLCIQLFDHILNCKNMGSGRNDVVQKAFDYRGGLAKATSLSELQRYGRQNWAALKKFPFLLPFAWLYQLCHYIKSVFKHKIPLSKLFGLSKAKENENKLFTRLGCPDDIVGE